MLGIPRKINLGSGKDFREDYINIDINPLWRPDTTSFCGEVAFTERFGNVFFEKESFDEILANDVLEHIPDLIATMTQALKLLRVGGVMSICVPYDLSYGAWQDPTHVRAFNERSWLYYTDWFWYLGWDAHRFELTRLDFMVPEGVVLTPDISQMRPRLIEAMLVTLEKVELTEEEKDLAKKYYKRGA